MQRRAPGEGSIFRVRRRRQGRIVVRYVAQISLGGRQGRRFETRTCRTHGEALVGLRELQAARAELRNPSKLLLGDYLERYIRDTAAPSVSPNTVRIYGAALIHLAPLAHIQLVDLTPEDIEHACAAMVTHRGKVTVPAAPKTVRNVQVFLRRALSVAQARGYITLNPARLVPLRRVPRAQRLPLGAETARCILDAVNGDRFEAAYALALVGLRAGEILGLARSDIHLGPEPYVEVRYQLRGSGRRAVRAELKTASSAGAVPLPLFVAELLVAHLALQDAERPFVPINDGLVFVTEAGYAVSGSWFTKHFQALLASAGLPRLTIHSLRHGAASLLVQGGVHPRVASQMLRHASSRVTMDIYSHVAAAQEREAAEVLQKLIGDRSVTRSVTGADSRVASGGLE